MTQTALGKSPKTNPESYCWVSSALSYHHQLFLFKHLCVLCPALSARAQSHADLGLGSGRASLITLPPPPASPSLLSWRRSASAAAAAAGGKLETGPEAEAGVVYTFISNLYVRKKKNCIAKTRNKALAGRLLFNNGG